MIKKRIISVLLIAVFIICVFPFSASASEGLANFIIINTYTPGQFSDVPSSAWYSVNVEIGYELGIISGKSADTYEPDHIFRFDYR